ncbi:tail assembly chaperone [Arthrobacter phage Andrew]|uniref:Tail assembly chaperone n=1 Tax=Arthrobacter phage Andrew TaxID=2419946 RepID=A0A3G2KD26_9CAUD|nr:tail assembly chaperone [Arthrobacter phage Andrew]AYN56831.1 tail assembly chaperone [Arthrobacter phage Andrew]
MTFEVPASKASIKQNQFEFKVPGERKARSLPLLKFVPLGLRSRLAEAAKPIQAAQAAGQDPALEDLQVLGSIQLELLNKYSPGLVDLVDDDQLGAILAAWQEASKITVGGIAGLCLLLEEHSEAIEYDLLVMGRRLDDLGTPALSWRDLLVIVKHSGPSSALVRAVQPELSAWANGTVLADLVALVADLLAAGNWQRQGKKSAPKPKRIKRPGAKNDDKHFGRAPIPVKDFDDWWNNPEGG